MAFRSAVVIFCKRATRINDCCSCSSSPPQITRFQLLSISKRCFASKQVQIDPPLLKPSIATDSAPSSLSVRLSKLVSQHAGLGLSRNAAERLIRSGEVTIAGEVFDQPQRMIDLEELLESSQGGREKQVLALKVQGKTVRLHLHDFLEQNKSAADLEGSSNNKLHYTSVWLVHKLKGELVADSDPHGRPCMMERLMQSGLGKRGGSKTLQHWKPIGRLDMMTEGLILVTNDGEYARQMELPMNQLHRTYRVRVHGILSDHKLSRIQRGVTVDGVKYAPMKVQSDTLIPRKRKPSTNSWLQVTCCEGKNRQIRNVFKYLGLNVTRLIRTSYGDYQLQTIPPGLAIEVPAKPIEMQRRKGFLLPRHSRGNTTAQKNGSRRIGSTDENDQTATAGVQWVRYGSRAAKVR